MEGSQSSEYHRHTRPGGFHRSTLTVWPNPAQEIQFNSCIPSMLATGTTPPLEGSRRHQQSGICMLGPLYSAFGYWTDRQTSLLQRSPLSPSPLIKCTRPVRHSAIWISSVRVQSRRSLCSFDKTLPRGWADSVGRQADRPTNCVPHPVPVPVV